MWQDFLQPRLYCVGCPLLGVAISQGYPQPAYNLHSCYYICKLAGFAVFKEPWVHEGQGGGLGMGGFCQGCGARLFAVAGCCVWVHVTTLLRCKMLLCFARGLVLVRLPGYVYKTGVGPVLALMYSKWAVGLRLCQGSQFGPLAGADPQLHPLQLGHVERQGTGCCLHLSCVCVYIPCFAASHAMFLLAQL